MSFVSWQYPLFLLGVFLLYWRLPWRGRILLLLVSSYFFYAVWDARFLALLLTSTTIDFYCGLAIGGQRQGLGKVFLTACLPVAWLSGYALLGYKAAPVTHWILGAAVAFPLVFGTLYQVLWRLPESKQRRAFLLFSILSNLGVLGFFKYFNFFAESAATILSGLGWRVNWTLSNVVLPVAISFYTFQSISYAVEIYRGKAQPERDFLTFAAYLSFFPQLVAGPIERPNDLLPQFQKAAYWDIDNFHRGLRLILVGLFKKVFVADNCALLANYVFDSTTVLNGYWAILGVLAFAFQIYGDFSGYTDIARGSARLLGIRLNRNFHFPYFSRSPSEFWQRWHITLSSWFRDYVYIPLGGNRHGAGAAIRNLWITMLLAGLWHGARWTFVLWGAYHGALLVLYRVVPALKRLGDPQAQRSWRVPASTALMFAWTLAGWALFRCHDVGQLANWIAAFGNWQATAALDWVKPLYWLLIHVTPLILLQIASWRSRDEVELAHLPWLARGLVYTGLFLLVTTAASNDVEFIYFQF